MLTWYCDCGLAVTLRGTDPVWAAWLATTKALHGQRGHKETTATGAQRSRSRANFSRYVRQSENTARKEKA